ncbi:hypothetical protein C8R43DRAFT_1238365 [Mycena crocata]|nr:hypothetical protein C8R43DRAFT_1238365 [Mycena crocata]
MFSKLIGGSIVMLALALGVSSLTIAPSMGPGPVQLPRPCGSPYDPPCPSGDLCCATNLGNVCQNGQLLCRVPKLPRGE